MLLAPTPTRRLLQPRERSQRAGESGTGRRRRTGVREGARGREPAAHADGNAAAAAMAEMERGGGGETNPIR